MSSRGFILHAAAVSLDHTGTAVYVTSRAWRKTTPYITSIYDLDVAHPFYTHQSEQTTASAESISAYLYSYHPSSSGTRQGFIPYRCCKRSGEYCRKKGSQAPQHSSSTQKHHTNTCFVSHTVQQYCCTSNQAGSFFWILLTYP